MLEAWDGALGSFASCVPARGARLARSFGGQVRFDVEDEPLIALSIHGTLSAKGASIIAATSEAEALEMVRSADVSMAILDLDLRGRDCSAVCRMLIRRGVPFVFYTGHSSGKALSNWPSAPVFKKPDSPEAMVDALVALARG